MDSFRPRLILFDIDGTLLKGGPRLRRWFGEALESVYGQAGDIDGHSFSGKTDPQIVTELMQGAGVSDERILSLLADLKEIYLGRMREQLTADDMTLLPDVVPVLRSLEEASDVTLGLLTGNWEGGARSKLACFDLNLFFPFGAFGDDRADRSDLPPVALERALQHRGHPFSPRETLIVGDSLRDVACARAHGIRAAAVATGYTTLEHLEATGADWVLMDLGEAKRIHPIFGS
jgi:phosphoglycolate phosphatase-like HAD superfamily hydrolase